MRRIGEACSPAIPAADDFVHYDFTLANLLSDGTAITGVIDVNPPVLAGDRAFDLATLLFYLYDQDDIRDPLRARLLELAGPQAARAYLAHMVLRQVDWSLRFHPEAAATGITCTWPGSSPLTATTAAQRNGLDSTHSPRRSAPCGLQVSDLGPCAVGATTMRSGPAREAKNGWPVDSNASQSSGPTRSTSSGTGLPAGSSHATSKQKDLPRMSNDCADAGTPSLPGHRRSLAAPVAYRPNASRTAAAVELKYSGGSMKPHSLNAQPLVRARL